MTRVAMLLGHDLICPTLDSRVYREARSLIETGYEVRVHCWARRADHLPPRAEADGIVVKRHNASLTGGFLARVRGFRQAMARLGTGAAADAPDLIHAHDLETLPAAARAARDCGAKLVFDAHEDWPLLERVQSRLIGWYHARQQRRWRPRADAVVTVSRELAAQLDADEVLYNSEPLTVVDAPAERDRRAELGLDGVVAGYIGGLRRAIMDELLRAVAAVPGVHLLVVGGPPRGQAGYDDLITGLEARATELGVRATFVGAQPFAGMADWYRACDVVLVGHYAPHPRQRHIAVPKKLLDAMAYGVPVIVGPYAARRRIVERHGCGLVANDFGAALQRLTTDGALRRRLGARGAAAYRAHYTWERQAAKLLALYQRLLTG